MPITVIDGPTIFAGQALSNAVDITAAQGKAIAGLLVPVDMPPTYISFQLSQGPDDFRELWSVHGYQVTIFTYPGARLVFDTNWSLTADFMKLRAGTTAVPIEQPVDRIFKTIIST